ncbi:hypothetical protein [Romboutsia sp.]|uniref:hypothetical protein n=1 Tax=Romboutsia sp. TaxID=1965302 RepID=UPI003F375DD5
MLGKYKRNIDKKLEKRLKQLSNNYPEDKDMDYDDIFNFAQEYANWYSKNDAVAFAEWILNRNSEEGSMTITTKIDRSNDERNEVTCWGTNRLGYSKTYTTEELYQLFKSQQNGL